MIVCFTNPLFLSLDPYTLRHLNSEYLPFDLVDHRNFLRGELTDYFHTR